MNKKLITGTITLAALLGIGASANNNANATVYDGNRPVGRVSQSDVPNSKYRTFFNNLTRPGVNGNEGADGTTNFTYGGNHYLFQTNGADHPITEYKNGHPISIDQLNQDLEQNGSESNNEDNNSNNTNQNGDQSPQYANSNTLPQTSETKNAKDVALAGLSALAASVALIGADPAKEAVKNKIVDRRLKYGI